MTPPSQQESALSADFFPPGTFTPNPQRASVARMVWSQGFVEAKLFLRHGEQQLLSFIIPLGMLLALAYLPLLDDPNPLTKGFPMMLALASMSSGFTGQAISLAFDRRYGALQRTGASGVPSWTIVSGKVLGVLSVSFIQIMVLGAVALALGWTSTATGIVIGLLVFFIGVAAFTSLGLLMGGTLSSELVLGLANLIWVVLVGVASYILFRGSAEPTMWLKLIPSVALSDGLYSGFRGSFPTADVIILLGWLSLGSVMANRWFKFSG
ncbi:ABC transporter permease [Corynebacterium ulcerans]|uniref:ABC transporter permease n=1 Tax=Corynebacterium ulcerans TaxID=65058 RepID=UPI00051F7FDF|nr:ABC transporter permease [Corynebacterium ulcerans]AIT89209.1 ABC-2 family transporter protein [Corynebacterium ulcerans]ALD94983.1 ABC-2 family transporter protein [Corynebacterium ulcerans]SQG58832.1 ABC transporter efflux protein, DrrB family [Corynebacterium ulcerans]